MRLSLRALSMLAAPIAALILVTACASAGGGSLAPASPSALAGASPSAGAGPVGSPEQAAALVLAQRPEFAGIEARNPELIGQANWYEVTPIAGGGWQVVVEMGWGDCPAGCIDKHRWTFAVAPDGSVGLIKEEGPPLPSGLGSSGYGY